MRKSAYPNFKQSLVLIVFFFISFALFFFFTGTLPQIFGWGLTESYKAFIFSVASPICTIPLIIYVSKKSGLPINWKVNLPGIRIIFLLPFLSIAVKIFLLPFINPIECFDNLIAGRYKLADFDIPNFNVFMIVNFILLVFIVPIFEEIFWRKQIFRLLLEKFSPIVSIVFSSVLFAGAHLRINGFGALFIWGLLFGYVYYKTNSIEVSILLHSFALGSDFFIKYKFINNTELPFFKYSIMLTVNVILICLVVKYLVRNSTLNNDLGFDNKIP